MKSLSSLYVQSIVRASSTTSTPTTAASVRNQSSVSGLLDAESAALDNTGLSQGELDSARPYSQVPGPKPYPLLGNTWRLLPYIGKCKSKIVTRLLTER